MATQKVRQDPGAQERLQGRRQRNDRNRRAGSIVAVLVLIAVAAAIFARAQSGTKEGPAHPGGPPVGPSQPPTLTNSIVDLHGGTITPLPASFRNGGSYYAASPDGTRVAFSLCCSRPGSVFVANLDGTGLRDRITPDLVGGMGAQWSPDGTRIVYQQRDFATEELGKLVVHDVGTGHDTTVVDFGTASNGWWFLFPSFTPDGRILYMRPTRSSWNLWSVPSTGGGTPTLVQRNVAWGGIAPDGTLAYVASMCVRCTSDFSGRDLMIRPAGGGAPRVLVSGGAIQWIRWSPDGTRIAYMDSGEIFVVTVASDTITRVGDGGSGTTVEWLDDHRLLIGPGA